jgi:hypothetical protein
MESTETTELTVRTEDEEKRDISVWAGQFVTELLMLEKLAGEMRGISMEVTGVDEKRVLVFEGIYKLAHMLGVKVHERYEPNYDDFPFVFEFKYKSVTFRSIWKEHIKCPEEYIDAKEEDMDVKQ